MAWPTITDGVTSLGKSLFDSIQTYIDGLSTLLFSNTGLKVQDTDASHALTIAPGSNLTANRTLTVTTGDAARTLTLSGDATISQDYSATGQPTLGGLTLAADNPILIWNDSTGTPRNTFAIRNGDAQLIVQDTTAAVDRWLWNASGHFRTVADNTYDLGLSGAGRPRFIYTGTALLSGAGSATAPPLSVDGDTNTGVWFPAADTVAVTTGGSERARVDSSGNLGVGTTTPSTFGKLAVSGGQSGTATSSAALMTPGSAQGEKADVALYTTFVGTADNGVRRTADIVAGFNGGTWGNEYLALHVGNGGSANDTKLLTAEKVRIDANGNVGINTTSPSQKLTVNGHVLVGGGSTASEIRLLEPSGSGSNYTAFKAQAQSADVTYTLPAADGTSGQLLSTNGSGSLSWTTVSATPSVLSKSANYTVSTSDGANVVVLCTNTITITLYAASGNSGKVVNVKNNGTGTITIDANASELIDGALTKTISAQYTNLSLVCDGTGWAII
jgi:hypothetical protein